MTETERIDGRIRDLAELCTRHGTPCADGLLAEIGRLSSEIDQQRGGKIGYFAAAAQAIEERDAARLVAQEMTRHWHEARGDSDALRLELERTEGDLGVAIREAAAAREALRAARPIVYNAARYWPTERDALPLIDAALDQRLTQ